MKKIITFAVFLIIIPFFMVTFIHYDADNNLKEISLNYVSDVVVRVYRENTGSVDNVKLEEYVVGVVSAEMPVSFDIEALKAQAVASRTYVLRKILDNKDKEYDVVDSVSDQVYFDDSILKNRWGNNYVGYINKVRNAVNETSMEYLVYDDDVINAMYFSTSNGYTEDYKVIFGKIVPYLVSVESLWDSDVSSVFNDSISMSLNDFYVKLNLPYNKKLNINNVIRSDTNRVISLDINGVNFKGSDLYTRLSLRSYDFDIQLVGSNIVIGTKGFGHGVGMSQYGAYGMAKNGYTYDKILKHYYTGTMIKKWEIS